MTENIEAFRRRTAFVWDSLPEEGGFVTHPRLTDKVDPAGRFRPFYGDTVIFDLTDEDKEWLSGLQRMLYTACGALLAEPLDPESFHITLHDLHSGTDADVVADAISRSREGVKSLLTSLPGNWAVSVRPTAVFSMVATSVVLGFEPVSEEDCAALMGLYGAIEQVVPVGYPLTPHVTLAYYRPIAGGEDMLCLLRKALAEVQGSMTPRTLTLSQPRYCAFTDMNHYRMHNL